MPERRGGRRAYWPFFLLLAMLGVALLSCAVGSMFSASNLSQVDSSTGIVKLTQSDFQAARAKWRSQHVEQYDVVVEWVAESDIAGTWVLRVKATGDKSQVVDYFRAPADQAVHLSDTGIAFPPALDPASDTRLAALQELTIEAQLAGVSYAVDGQFRLYTDYMAEFDPGLGYPVALGETGGRDAGDTGFSYRVKQLKITQKKALQP
ncbi:MAG: hypothetical protein M3014_01885 [Chloroflexota bacterium]|nr:hypothetical protein [Chloroflexota bacterium]